MNPEPTLEELQQKKVSLDRAMEMQKEVIYKANFDMEGLRREKRWTIGKINELKIRRASTP